MTPHGVDARWDQDRGGDVPGVPAAFAGLGADEVSTRCEHFGDVFWVPDHLIIIFFAV